MKKLWLLLAITTTALWGVWGALIELPEKAGFPATLGYTVWALTMIPCALVALASCGWKLERDRRSILYGLIVGLTGAGGQIVLFQALRSGPAYIVFPIISLYPVITVALSTGILKERASRRAWLGIIFALIAIPLLSYQPADSAATSGKLWLVLAGCTFLAWGIQGFFMKFANERMRAESIFAYMALAGLLLIPFAVAMTDFSADINWGFRGPYLAALIQVLNSMGALAYVFAVRYGKAIIVVPLTALAPVLTIFLSLALYGVVPHAVLIGGMVLAVIAIYLMAEA
jgi:drug/metabolite transporter (DMT)-like permease